MFVVGFRHAMTRNLFSGVILTLLALSPRSSLAQKPAAGEADLPVIRITDPNRDLLRLAVPNVVGDLGGEATTIERRDFEVVGMFRQLDPVSFPPALQQEGLGFSSALWGQVGAQAVAKLRAAREGGNVVVEGRLYQIGRGESPVLSKTYRGGDLRALVHRWVNDVIQQFTGIPGVLGSRIAFAQAGGGREIASVGMDGGEAKVLTRMNSESLLPAYSPTGREVAFTSFLLGGAHLWIVSADGGRARAISKRSGMNSGAVWYPDGVSIAVTLSHEGNPEIYKIRASNGDTLQRLTNANASDLSPSLSGDGGQIAFVSDRGGSPQIYVMGAGGGGGKRLTFQGNQNTTPKFNPKADKPLIAFTGRDERLNFDIFVYDLKTGKIDRMTQSQGSNYDPAWSPDGRLLVYASSRGGLFVMNVETRKELQIYRGGAHSPSWGPAPPAR
jgi:TolB protein